MSRVRLAVAQINDLARRATSDADTLAMEARRICRVNGLAAEWNRIGHRVDAMRVVANDLRDLANDIESRALQLSAAGELEVA